MAKKRGKKIPPVEARVERTANGGVRLTAPWPPASNNLHFVANRRKVLSREGRDYHATVLAAVLLAGSPKVLSERLRATLDVYPPDLRRRDVVNLEKVVTDSLVRAAVIIDDCLIKRWVITERNVFSAGMVVLTIEPWDGRE